MTEIGLLLAGTLATYRLAQIVAQDVISEPFRAWVTRGGAPLEALPPVRRWVALGVTCVVCVSVWAGLGLAVLVDGLTGAALVHGLAFSGGAVVLGSWLAAQGRSGR